MEGMGVATKREITLMQKNVDALRGSLSAISEAITTASVTQMQLEDAQREMRSQLCAAEEALRQMKGGGASCAE